MIRRMNVNDAGVHIRMEMYMCVLISSIHKRCNIYRTGSSYLRSIPYQSITTIPQLSTIMATGRHELRKRHMCPIHKKCYNHSSGSSQLRSPPISWHYNKSQIFIIFHNIANIILQGFFCKKHFRGASSIQCILTHFTLNVRELLSLLNYSKG